MMKQEWYLTVSPILADLKVVEGPALSSGALARDEAVVAEPRSGCAYRGKQRSGDRIDLDSGRRREGPSMIDEQPVRPLVVDAPLRLLHVAVAHVSNPVRAEANEVVGGAHGE